MVAELPLKQWFLASRPLSWVNTAYPFFITYLLTAGWDATLIVGTLFFLIPYNFALYGVNDVFDYASDQANPRKGGIEGAVLKPRFHTGTLLAAGLSSLPFLIFLIAVGDRASWLVLALSMFALLAYSVPVLRFKERPFVDSATSSFHFVSPAWYGLVLAGSPLQPGIVMALIAFFLWGIASHAFGAVQDILPDRQAGIASIATVLGARWTVRFAIVSWILAGAAASALGWPAMLSGLLVLPYILAASPFANIADEQSAAVNRGWKRFLALNYLSGFLLTMLIIAIWLG